MLGEIDAARQQLLRRTAESDHAVLRAKLAEAGVPVGECIRALDSVTEACREGDGFLASARSGLTGPVSEPGVFERFLLLEAALQALDRLESEPVPPAVKRHCADLFCRWASVPPDVQSGNRFAQLAKIVTLRRLPAGLFDWETSGLPRSWIPRIRPLRELLRTVRLIGSPTRPFRPVFFAHLTVCRPVRAMLPADARKSYYLMARAMELQGEVKALVTASWFHSPDTHRVSPHLAWLNEIFLRHGGIVATIGKADVDAGVFNRSPERREAFDQGRFTPTEGLVIWPREPMLAWARQHPELEAA